MTYSELFSLTGKHAVVIGAGGGIGREVARGLAAFDATVTVADRNGVAARETAELIGSGRGIELDIVDAAAVNALAAERPADIAITTVGVNVRKRLADLTDADFDRVLNTNLRSVFRVIQAFAPGMAERGRGACLPSPRSGPRRWSPGRGCMPHPKPA